MSTGNLYLAVFLGSKTGAKRAAWDALTEEQRQAKQKEGFEAWGAWMQKHQASLEAVGGPLGKTKQASMEGIEDVTNELSAFTIVRAETHEAAARLFEKHPHFAIFPGDSIQIMPILPIPGAPGR
jgi:hypothetical protein